MVRRILLFGSTGMLGSYIYSYFSNNTSISIIAINDYRVTNDSLSALENILFANGIDEHTCVINCIGLIPQRKHAFSLQTSCVVSSENHRTPPSPKGTCVLSSTAFFPKPDSDYYLINAIFPQLLSVICQKYNAKMIQPTTDCVFSGNREDGNYTEYDIHDETGHYGMSKSLGEPSNLNCTVIRTSIIGRERFNQKSFLEWVLSNDEISGWSNHYWNGITCLEYCKFIEKIIQENLFWKGVRHVFSPTAVSKYELACMIKDVFDQESTKIRETICEHTVNKTLDTKYERLFEINELYEQLNELKQFALI